MRLVIGDYILDINADENERYYKNERYVSAGCQCDGCQNYEPAVETVSPEVKKLFAQLGTDIKKPAEVYVNDSDQDILHYGGFYHLCGRIIQGESPWETISETKDSATYHLAENKMVRIADNFKIAFQEKCSLINESFPRPCIQMEIMADLPWLLQKKNTYYQEYSAVRNNLLNKLLFQIQRRFRKK